MRSKRNNNKSVSAESTAATHDNDVLELNSASEEDEDESSRVQKKQKVVHNKSRTRTSTSNANNKSKNSSTNSSKSKRKRGAKDAAVKEGLIDKFFTTKTKNKQHGIKTARGSLNLATGKVRKSIVSDWRPENEGQREEARMNQSMLGYVNLGPGRPKKSTGVSSGKFTTSKQPAPAKAPPKPKVKPKAVKRGTYKKEEKGSDYELAMELGIRSLILSNGDMKLAMKDIEKEYEGMSLSLSKSTLRSRWQKRVELMSESCNKDEEENNLSLFDRSKDNDGGNKLTTEADRNLLMQIAVARDNNNKGMSRKEMITFIAEIKGVKMKTAENHYDYLIRIKALKRLTGGGRVVTAQSTTTNRTAITSAKLLRTHMTFELALEQQRQKNGWKVPENEEEKEKYLKMVDHFILNLDESCMMASDGNVRIIGNVKKKKHEKNNSDSRDSITTVRIGSAGGAGGPRIFLAKGKSNELKTLSDMPKNHNSPPGSCVVMTPSAYMTNEAWAAMSEGMCKGIREMPVIRDHPDKWVVFSLDGFGSHLDPSALEISSEYKILVIKEEGDTSQVSQAYDQQVAKKDKQWARELLDTIKTYNKRVLDQFKLILIVNQGITEVEKGDAWRKSFVRVNMCPSKRVPFKVWLNKNAVNVESADKFFQERTSLMDAMPAVWQHMSDGQRRQLCSLFDTFNNQWTKDNLVKVMKLGFVHLDDMTKLRGCYMTSKEDPSVLLDSSKELTESSTSTAMHQTTLDKNYSAFSLSPTHLMKKYMSDKADHPNDDDYVFVNEIDSGVVMSSWPEGRSRSIAGELFCHMTNFVAATHGWHTGGNLVPSSHLDIAISNEQVDLLNPTPHDIQIGAIIDQCVGRYAKRRIARRRIDIISGNINSYARILNGPAELSKIKTYNELTASMAELQKERDEQAESSRAKKKKTDEEKAAKKQEKEKKEKEDHVRLLPICMAHVEKGIEHIKTLNVANKRAILLHVYNCKTPSNINKPDVDALINTVVTLPPPLPVDNTTAEDNEVVPNEQREEIEQVEEVQQEEEVEEASTTVVNTNALWLLRKCIKLRNDIDIDMSDVELAIIAIRELNKIKLQQNNGYVYDGKTYSGKFKAAFRGRYIGDSSKQVSDDFIKDLVEKCTELMDDETLNEESMRATAAEYNTSSVAAV